MTASLLDWFAVNARDLPWRRTKDPYAIWVSEIMLQQTQVKTVVPYWERWMAAIPTVEALAAAEQEILYKLWQGLGYYTRVRNLQRAAQVIVREHQGRFPQHFEAVLSLPGIGRYTAGAICSIAFNQPTPILDGNVIRVLARLFGVHGRPTERLTSAKLWSIAEELVTHASKLRRRRACSHLNQALMELGATVCVPAQPRCEQCPIRGICHARRTGTIDQLPQTQGRQKPVRRHFLAFVIQRGRRLLVRQRPEGVVNGHLWEFPNVETEERPKNSRHSAARTKWFEAAQLVPLCTVKHSITKSRITLEAFSVAKATQAEIRELAGGQSRWVTLDEAGRLPFSSAHAKVLSRLAEGGACADPAS